MGVVSGCAVLYAGQTSHPKPRKLQVNRKSSSRLTVSAPGIPLLSAEHWARARWDVRKSNFSYSFLMNLFWSCLCERDRWHSLAL